jgi:hypothetical protein
MYNITLRHLHIAIVGVEKQWVYIFCSLWCPACKAHVPRCLINGMIFRKSFWTQMCVLIFLSNFCPKHFSFEEEFSRILLLMYVGVYEIPIILVRLQSNLNFLDRFSKSTFSFCNPLLAFQVSDSMSQLWNALLSFTSLVPPAVSSLFYS